jgi:hypothetical protein
MATRRRRGRRRLLLWWGSLGLWCGCLGLWCGCLGLWCGCLGLWCGCLGLWCGCLGLWRGCHRLSWRGQRLFCSRWRCRDRRRDRLYRRCRDLWRLRRNNLPHGGWPDQCGEHRAVCARFRPAQIVCAGGSVLHARSDLVHRLVRRGMSPLRSEPRRHRQLCSTDHARGGAYQGGDHRILGMYSPPTHSHRLRRRYAVMFRCGHTPISPSRRAPNLRVCAKVQW